jgi:hypothetical protein
MPGFKGKLYTNAKFTLRESPYFQNFSSNQKLRRKVHSTLIIQECKQWSILSNTTSDTNKFTEFVKLSMWWLPQTSNTHIVAAIRINVHPAGENSIDTPHAFHARFTYGSGPYISLGPRSQSFASPHKDETYSYTREKSWRLKRDWPGRRLGSPHSPFLTTTME